MRPRLDGFPQGQSSGSTSPVWLARRRSRARRPALPVPLADASAPRRPPRLAPPDAAAAPSRARRPLPQVRRRVGQRHPLPIAVRGYEVEWGITAGQPLPLLR